MAKKTLVSEIFLMRALACLSIVLLHALTRAFVNDSSVVNNASLLLTFGTPAFIFISEFIIARTYENELPSRFWEKRFKFLFLPYILFGAIYAFSKGFEQSLSTGAPLLSSVGSFLWRHILLGDFHGYFILIIFQFYLLHFLFYRYLQKWKPVAVIAISLLINIVYLGFFNFVPAPATAVGAYVWSVYYWIPFFGWLFYFTVAYYCGRYYEQFIILIKKYAVLVSVAPLVFGALTLVLFQTDILPIISSKRIDMLFFAMSMILFIYLVAMKMRTIPALIVVVSQYSFGIYLLHPLFLAVMVLIVNRLQIGWHPVILSIVYFIGSTILSMGTMYVLNKIPYGSYVVGRIGIGLRGKQPNRRPYERKGKSLVT